MKINGLVLLGVLLAVVAVVLLISMLDTINIQEGIALLLEL